MRTEYISEIKRLLQENYEPVNSVLQQNEYTERKSLKSIHKMLTGVLPQDWIYESDVYIVLEELGFKNFLLTEEVLTEDEDGEPVVKTYTVMAYLLEKKTAAI